MFYVDLSTCSILIAGNGNVFDAFVLKYIRVCVLCLYSDSSSGTTLICGFGFPRSGTYDDNDKRLLSFMFIWTVTYAAFVLSSIVVLSIRFDNMKPEIQIAPTFKRCWLYVTIQHGRVITEFQQFIASKCNCIVGRHVDFPNVVWPIGCGVF